MVNNEDSVRIEVARLYKMTEEGNLKAFADVNLNGLVIIKGVRVVGGKKGLFVSMPREKGKDGKWYDSVSPLTKEIREKLNEAVLECYAL